HVHASGFRETRIYVRSLVLLIAHPFHAEAALELGQPKIRAARKSAPSRWGVRGTGLEEHNHGGCFGNTSAYTRCGGSDRRDRPGSGIIVGR
ncbi:unnamed protein product, partial [Ectocarpus sp. 12 AP-2014]